MSDHEHNWHNGWEGDTLVAYCTVDGCDMMQDPVGSAPTPMHLNGPPSRPTVPDEAAVEAAARAMFLSVHPNLNWSSLPPSLRERWMDMARAALAAARPILDAQTREQVAVKIQWSADNDTWDSNERALVSRGAVIARRVGGSGA